MSFNFYRLVQGTGQRVDGPGDRAPSPIHEITLRTLLSTVAIFLVDILLF